MRCTLPASLVILSMTSVGSGQSLSMRERARQLGGVATNSGNADFGIGRPEELMALSEVVLRGVAVAVTPKLEADESMVVTDYTVAPLQFLKLPKSESSKGEPQRIVVRQPGGTLIENGLRMTTNIDIFPEDEFFALGDDVIMFLIYDAKGGVYNFAGGPFGAFQVQLGNATAMTKRTAERRGDVPVEVTTFLYGLSRLVR